MLCAKCLVQEGCSLLEELRIVQHPLLPPDAIHDVQGCRHRQPGRHVRRPAPQPLTLEPLPDTHPVNKPHHTLQRGGSHTAPHDDHYGHRIAVSGVQCSFSENTFCSRPLSIAPIHGPVQECSGHPAHAGMRRSQYGTRGAPGHSHER